MASLSDGGFVSFLLLIGVFFRPVEKINAVIETYPKGIAGFRRYTELLDTEPDIVDAPGAVAVSGLKGRIRYEGVSFGYSAERLVLDGSSWRSPPARRWRSSGHRARGRRRSARCCRVSTRWMRGGSRLTGSISAG